MEKQKNLVCCQNCGAKIEIVNHVKKVISTGVCSNPQCECHLKKPYDKPGDIWEKADKIIKETAKEMGVDTKDFSSPDWADDLPWLRGEIDESGRKLLTFQKESLIQFIQSLLAQERQALREKAKKAIEADRLSTGYIKDNEITPKFAEGFNQGLDSALEVLRLLT